MHKEYVIQVYTYAHKSSGFQFGILDRPVGFRLETVPIQCLDDQVLLELAAGPDKKARTAIPGHWNLEAAGWTGATVRRLNRIKERKGLEEYVYVLHQPEEIIINCKCD